MPTLTNAQIAAGAAILCDCARPSPIGRNTAVGVYEAMRPATPAASAIPSWRARIGKPADFPLTCATPVEQAMEAENAELRAALAAATTPITPAAYGQFTMGVGEDGEYELHRSGARAGTILFYEDAEHIMRALKDADRWRAFRARDGYDNLDFDRFRDQFREDADAIVDAARASKQGNSHDR
jgi:hypothetical protein